MSKLEGDFRAVLAKKRDAPAKEAFGINIYPKKEDGRPDFTRSSLFIQMYDLKALLEGLGNWHIPVEVREPYNPKGE